MGHVPDGFGSLKDPPWDVRVTLTRAPRARMPMARMLAALLVSALIVAGVVELAVEGVAQPSKRSAVAAAYRYPLGCLGASLSGAGRISATHPPDGQSPCWRYGIYVTAILRRVHGSWGLALEAISPSCPPISLPAFVREQVAVCLRARAR